ncbi:MAG: PilT/PilU family type 4a pilus ATPase [Acidobacteria bacterium]|nr:PilT/PilU family type 4a pilus ATPase [Acidobacteriota bacterium]
MPKIDQLFEIMLQKGGSDLHMNQGQKPKLRVHGHLESIESFPVLTEPMMVELMREIADQSYWDRYVKRGDIDFAYSMGDRARFRASYLKQMHGLGAVFRTIPSKILTLEQLEAPDSFKSFGELRSGLILITGPTGSGKSTTLAAIIDFINSHKRRKIITIEEPVEFMHQSKQSTVIHREVGPDTDSFYSGLKGALKSDANVILVGEMRDRETIELALTAVEMGILVFGTLHTNSAAKTVDRIVDVFPAKQKDEIRSVLANTLRGVVSQQLLRSSDGSRRYAAQEILLFTGSLPAVIRSGDTNKLQAVIQAGKKNGMRTMDDHLMELVTAGKVSKEEALLKAFDKARFS